MRDARESARPGVRVRAVEVERVGSSSVLVLRVSWPLLCRGMLFTPSGGDAFATGTHSTVIRSSAALVARLFETLSSGASLLMGDPALRALLLK